MKSFIIIFCLILFSLPVLGQETLRIEIDYMVKYDANDSVLHTHRPNQIEIDAVIQMFACHEITLIIEISDEVPHYDVMKRNPNNGEFFSYTGDESFGSIRNTYRDHSDSWGSYCVFGHQYENNDFNPSGSSGLGLFPGTQFIVTLGAFSNQIGTPFERASTLAHEFGHNIFLGHCGPWVSSCPGGDDKINFPSIMSYRYQLAGVRDRMELLGMVPENLNYYKNLDYSYGILCDIDESALNEKIGVGLKKVDWDCDGAIDNSLVAQDTERDGTGGGGWCNSTGDLGILQDLPEWGQQGKLVENYRLALKTVEPQEISCITKEEWDEVQLELGIKSRVDVEIEPCLSSFMYFAEPYSSSNGAGDCEDPFTGIGEAQTQIVPGSIIYLKNLLYTEPGTSLVLNKKMILVPTNRAIIQPASKKSNSEN